MIRFWFKVFMAVFVGALFGREQAKADGCFVYKWDKKVDINEPNQKAIIFYDAGREDMLLQVKYEGNLREFGWLVPVPNLPKVEKGSMECFYELSKLTQEQRFGNHRDSISMGLAGGNAEESVKVVEQKTVGEYQVAVLSAKDAQGLQAWLKSHEFSVPGNGTQIINEYIQKQWYFVAVKINLDKRNEKTGSRKAKNPKRTEIQQKLASGELHPLLISFDALRCVFPLKISAINGKQSEVSLYIVSSQLLSSSALLRPEAPDPKQEEAFRTCRENEAILMTVSRWNSMMTEREIDAQREVLRREEPWDYLRLWEAEPARLGAETTLISGLDGSKLTQCRKQFTRLQGKTCCVSKFVRTFRPEDMRDLEFDPAVYVLSTYLRDPRAGKSAAEALSRCGEPGIASLLSALASTNRIERISAASAGQFLEYKFRDRFWSRLTDPEPEVVAEVLRCAWAFGQMEKEAAFKRAIPLFCHPDKRVRAAACRYIASRDALDTATLLNMLRSPNEGAQASALCVLASFSPTISLPRQDLLRLFATTNQDVMANLQAMPLYRLNHLTSKEVGVLLSSKFIMLREMGVALLRLRGDKDSVELAIGALRDPSLLVRLGAHRLLLEQTGQTFPADYSKWGTWWDANKATFHSKTEVIKMRLEERRIKEGTPGWRSGRVT